MTSTDYIFKLVNVFKQKGWDTKDDYEEVLNSLKNFHNVVLQNDDEYNLFFDLLNNFQWISLDEYYRLYKNLLSKFIRSLPNTGKPHNVYIFPIIKGNDEQKIKSGHSVSYIIKALLPRLDNKITIEIINNFSEFKSLQLGNNKNLLLVDDFIGSGETLNNCFDKIKTLNSTLLNKTDNIFILTIAITKNILNILNNYSILYEIMINKGISDFYTNDKLTIYKKSMSNIENRIFKLNWLTKYSFGYNQQECLISMLRCPDNTFPIFWGKYKKAIYKKSQSPFLRHE